jgi:ornithine cyclodeaminase
MCEDDPDTAIASVAAAMSEAARADTEGRRLPVPLPGDGEAMVLAPGLLPGIPAYTVKVNAKFPGADPALRGVVCLHSVEDGELLALIDSASLTSWRTGIVGALVTDRLARRGADSLGIIGAGAQAGTFLLALAGLRRISTISIHDIAPAAAERLAAEAEALGIESQIEDEPARVAARSAILMLATWSRRPILAEADLRPGTHVTSLGADGPGKVELDADVLDAARLVVDDPDLVLAHGALASSGLGRDVIDATLSGLEQGRDHGRWDETELTVFAPVGLPWQDLALAWPLYRQAEASGIGTRFDLLG